MKIHESGDRNKPVILLLPGTMCYWKANFEEVISELENDFLVAAVAYTGFDETDKESYSSVTDELEKIEDYVQNHYEGKILASYGCSLGGTFIAHLAARHRISMKYGIIGSSDMDQAGEMKARLLSSLIVKLTYNFVHNGEYKTKLMRKRYEKQMADPDPYNRKFVALTGIGRYDLSFITKQSIRNQFMSDLTTPLPLSIDNGETQIHIFYAKKMGEKYLERYRKYFRDPIIHEQDLRHEEFLGLYPKQWCALIRQICFGEKL